MPCTPKIVNPGTEHWVEYTEPDLEPNGSWRIAVTGKIRLVERRIIIVTRKKTVWGKTPELAIQGGLKAAGVVIESILQRWCKGEVEDE